MLRFNLTPYGEKRGIPVHHVVGFIPTFLSEHDERPAKEQLDTAYVGGWRPLEGWRLDDTAGADKGAIKYPGDPSLRPLAVATLRDETIYVYDHAWVCLMQPDGSIEVSRMD